MLRLNALRRDEVSAAVTEGGIAQLEPLVGTSDAVGTNMAVRAAGLDADPETIASSLVLLIAEILNG